MAAVNGGSYHDFYELRGGTPVGKLGAMHYLLDESGEKLVNKGFHEVQPASDGYKAKTGGTSYEVTKSGGGYEVRRTSNSCNKSPNSSGNSLRSTELDSGTDVNIDDQLTPENDSEGEIVRETIVGFPGFRTRRLVEKYQEGDKEVQEIRTEVSVLGKNFCIQRNGVRYSKEEE